MSISVKEIGIPNLESLGKLKNGGTEVLNDDIYIIVKIIFQTYEFYTIWYDYDFFVKENDNIWIFESDKVAQKFCLENYGDITKILEMDFNDHNMECSMFLDKWNVIGDLAKTLKNNFVGNDDDYTSLYSKFVYGSNIPALNTSGKKYVPKFSEEELEKIENVKADMIKILKSAFKIE